MSKHGKWSVYVKRYAPTMFKNLQGVFCIYKPRDQSMGSVVNQIKYTLAKDLREMPNYIYEREAMRKKLTAIAGEQGLLGEAQSQSSNDSVKKDDSKRRELGELVKVDLEHEKTLSQDILTNVTQEFLSTWKYSDHRLARGPRYGQDDFHFRSIDNLTHTSSGIIVCVLGHYHYGLMKKIKDAKLIRAYHVSGRFGQIRDDFTESGRLQQKVYYQHVKRAEIDRVCVWAENNHRKNMFEKIIQKVWMKLWKELIAQLLWLLKWYIPILFCISGVCKLFPWFIPSIYRGDRTNCMMIRISLCRMFGDLFIDLGTIMAALGALELYGTACIVIASSKNMIFEGYTSYSVVMVVNLIFAIIWQQLLWALHSLSTLFICLFCCWQVFVLNASKRSLLKIKKARWKDFGKLLIALHVLKYVVDS